MKIEKLVSEYHNLECELDSLNKIQSDDEKAVVSVVKKINTNKIFNFTYVTASKRARSLSCQKTMLYIPHLFDIFCMVVISGKLNESDSNVSEMTIRLKNSVAQDIVYAVSNATIKTSKSVLFPPVVKSLCNNSEVIKIINPYGHYISYDKVEKIETEYALKVTDEQRQSRVITPEDVTANNCDSSVALMVVDNINNLENIMTSHRVNYILVAMKAPETNQEVEEGEEEYGRPTKRKCRRILGKVVTLSAYQLV